MIQNFELLNHRPRGRPLLQISSTARCARGRARIRTGRRALAAPGHRAVAQATGSKIVLPIFAGYRNGIIRDHLTDALKQHLPPASGTDFQACRYVISKLCAKYITFSNNMQMAGAKKVHGRASESVPKAGTYSRQTTLSKPVIAHIGLPKRKRRQGALGKCPLSKKV